MPTIYQHYGLGIKWIGCLKFNGDNRKILSSAIKVLLYSILITDANGFFPFIASKYQNSATFFFNLTGPQVAV